MALNIAVIGAGIVGVCSAGYLQRDGHTVTVFDPVAPGGSCSFGNLGSLSPGSCVPLAMPGVLRKVPKWLVDRDGPLHLSAKRLPAALPWLVRFAAAAAPARVARIADALSALHSHVFEAYAPLLKSAGAENLVQRLGQLYVFETEESYRDARAELELRRARGERQEMLDADELRQFEPALALRCARGVFLPDAGHCVDPEALVRSFAEAFVRAGGRIENQRVTGLAADGKGVSLRTEAASRRFDRIVIAGGAWSNGLLRLLGANVPLESLRGYHAVLRRTGRMPRMAIRFTEAKIMATPMAMGIRIGGTIEIAGLAAPPRAGRAKALAALGARLFVEADGSDFTEWMGHRPGTPDSLPVIGPLARHPAVICAFGHGQTGLTGAAITGRLVADHVARRAPMVNLSPYLPARFGA
jgi:D-amino-acid dehydrogenase